MKRYITIVLFTMAFTMSANAQEAKHADKKVSCCSSKTADKNDSKPKCKSNIAVNESKACGVSTSSDADAAGPGQAQATTTAEAAEKKSCIADGSCCGTKASAPKA